MNTRLGVADFYLMQENIKEQTDRDRPSQPGTIHFLIGKFFYFVIRFLY